MQTVLNRRFVGFLLSGLVCTCGLSALAQEPGDVLVKSAVSCGSWITVKSPTLSISYRLWLAGYLSGFAVGTGKDILKDTDPSSLALWVDNFCRANPLQDLGDAAFQLANELIRLKRL